MQRLLIDSLVDAAEIKVDIRQGALRQGRFHAAYLSLELLSELVKLANEPLPLLEQVPLDWYRLRLVAELLTAGRSRGADPSLHPRGCVPTPFTRLAVSKKGESNATAAWRYSPLCETSHFWHRSAIARICPTPSSHRRQAHGLDMLAAASPIDTLRLLEHAHIRN